MSIFIQYNLLNNKEHEKLFLKAIHVSKPILLYNLAYFQNSLDIELIILIDFILHFYSF
jgi:hypothetical protein